MSNIFVFRQPPHGFIDEYFGGGKGGSTTTTNNVTQIPPEVLARYNAVNARAETVAEQPYQAYSNDPNAFVAPLNATQQAGIQNTNIMAGAAQPYYGAATNQLMQAQAGAQPGINAAYQNVGQAQNQGQQYLGAATQNVGQAQNQGQQYLGAATAAGLSGAQAIDPSQLNINQYMNPFTQNVVNATQAAMNQQQGQQLSQQQAEAIRGGAFGGERAGLQRGQLMGQQSLAQAQAIAPLYQQNYQQALAAAQQQQGVGLGAAQANRAAIQNYAQQLGNLGQQGYQQGMGVAQQYGALGQQGYQQNIGAAQQQAALAQQGYGMGAQTSAALAGLGTNAQQAGLAGAQAQLAAGQTQQQTQQAGLQALYNQFQQQQGFPYQQAQFLANIAEGTGALSGNATNGTSTTTGGGGFFSDERLKENIQKVGETNDGQPIYRYNYKGDKNTQIGLLAQDVEKHHPEAVGLAGGYKTVNYKKATEDAVHKADGGAAGDAYSMGAPSQMLQENSGKGLGAVPTLPQMITGPQRIEAGANAADVAAMRAPKATGFSLGVPEAKQAEIASLQSTLANPGPNANQLGSGPDYLQNRIGTLQDWLSKNAPSGTPYSAASSQGGLVSQPGNFARGGLAGGYADGGYMSPALAYYSPQQGQQDLIKLQPAGQHGILQGQQMQAPQRKPEPNPIAEANQMASLALSGGKIYDWAKKPSTSGYSNDFTPGGNNKDTLIDLNTDPSVEPIADLARGGVAGGRHPFKGDGYVNPYGNLGGNDILGPIIEQQDTSLRIPGDKGTPAPSSKPQQSGGLGELAQAAGMGEKAYKGANWAAGKLGLGEASPTAMSATSTEAIPGVASGVVPEAVAPGVASGVVPEAVAPVVPEAVTAAVPEALTAGLAGAETVAAPVAMAAAEGVADLAPLLFFLKNGGAVPRRHHFEDGGFETGTSQILPADTASDPNFDAMPTEELAPSTRGDRENLTVVPRTLKSAPSEAAPAPRAREPGVAAASRPSFSMPDVGGLIPEGAKDTLSSENFWVPAIAGLGAMLASPNKTLAGAIGSGLVGGTSAYTGLEKQQADIMKQRYDLAKGLFRGPTLVGDKWMWEDTQTGEMIPQNEYQRRQQAFITGKSAARPIGPAPTTEADTSTLGTAKDIIATPQERPVPRAAPQTAGAPQAAAPAIAAPAAPVTPVVPAVVPAVPAPQATAPTVVPPASPAQALFDSTDPLKAPPSALQIQQAALANDDLWRGSDPSQNPRVLLPRVAKADQEIAGLQAQADALTAQATRATNERGPEAAKPLIDRATGLQAQADRVRKQRDDDRAAAKTAIDAATQLDIKRAELITQKQAELQMAPAAARQALISEIAKLKETATPIAEAKAQETRAVEAAKVEPSITAARASGKGEEVGAEANVKAQYAARETAAAGAQLSSTLIQQSQQMLDTMFDPRTGKSIVSTGPLGPQIAKIAGIAKELGVDPDLINKFTNADKAAELEKQTVAMATEIGRQTLGANNAFHQTQFMQFLKSVPGLGIPAEAFRDIVDNTIIPQSKLLIGRYQHVADMDPAKTNVQKELLKYELEHPWYVPKNIPQDPEKRSVGQVYEVNGKRARWTGNGWDDGK